MHAVALKWELSTILHVHDEESFDVFSCWITEDTFVEVHLKCSLVQEDHHYHPHDGQVARVILWSPQSTCQVLLWSFQAALHCSKE